MCRRLRAGGQGHPVLSERRHMDPERAPDLRPGPVSDPRQSGQRESDVHGRGLQVRRFLRVQIRIHDCRRWYKVTAVHLIFKKLFCFII